MTGQGSKDFEAIAKGKTFAGSALDVSRNYRTANGCAVRALKVMRTNKTVIGGKVITTAHSHFIISGQVKVKHGWMPADWNAEGRHPQEQYNLIEVKDEARQQTNLF